MEIKGLSFVQTCDGCPEQYDVFDCLGNQVGYVRLRFSDLRCNYLDVFGEVLYRHHFTDNPTGLKGCFDTEDERREHLNIIADKINEKIKSTYKLEVGVKVHKKSTDRNLIISHHPLIFGSINTVTDEKLLKLI